MNPAPVPAFRQQAPGVAVRFESPEPGATLHRVTGGAVATSSVYVAGHYGTGTSRANSFERVCTGPCAFTAPMGTHELALSVPGHHDPVIADPITLDRNGVLRGTYHSNAGIRAVGWTILIGGLATSLGLLLGAASLDHDDESLTENSTAMTMIYGSLGLLGAAPLLSLPFTMQRDTAELHLAAQ